MSKLLFVTSSIFGENSKSRALGREFVEAWTRRHPGTRVVERDLVADSVPHVTGAVVGAAMTPAEQRSPEQRVAFDRGTQLGHRMGGHKWHHHGQEGGQEREMSPT